jgi:hypothetical protein
VVTELERAIWAAAEPIRATRFGKILRNAWVSERDPSLPGPDEDTHGWELSFDPAIQRTLGGTMAIAMACHSPPDTESEWFKWNLAAKRAVTRIAAKCWAGIDSQRRLIFVDEDNLQPILGRRNIYDLRSETVGRHLDFEGLSEPEVRNALTTVYMAARATPAYEDALRADNDLQRSPRKLALWAQLAEKGHRGLQATTGLTIQEARQRGLESVIATYADTPVEDIASAFRRYNRLVQQIIWSVLGLAEIIPEPFVLTDPVGTLRCTPATDASPFIRVTSIKATSVFLRPTHPIWLETRTPLDGLYLLVGYSMNLAPGAASDLSLTPITWSAGYWPGRYT